MPFEVLLTADANGDLEELSTNADAHTSGFSNFSITASKTGQASFE